MKRIVANIATTDVGKAKAFYGDVLGLDLVMNLGWIATFASNEEMRPQLSLATEAGSGTAVPDMSIEVDDLEEALGRIRAAKVRIEYGPKSEPWGVRRF